MWASSVFDSPASKGGQSYELKAGLDIKSCETFLIMEIMISVFFCKLLVSTVVYDYNLINSIFRSSTLDSLPKLHDVALELIVTNLNSLFLSVLSSIQFVLNIGDILKGLITNFLFYFA